MVDLQGMEQITFMREGASVSSLKRCTKCFDEKPLMAFSKNSRSKDGLQYQCKACNANWQRENSEKRRASWVRYRRSHYLRKKYGITDLDYWNLFLYQKGCCGICGFRGFEHEKHPDWQRPLHIDHDHATGEVRGLLCHKCNSAIGLLRESPEIFEKAAEWLHF